MLYPRAVSKFIDARRQARTEATSLKFKVVRAVTVVLFKFNLCMIIASLCYYAKTQNPRHEPALSIDDSTLNVELKFAS